MLEKKWRKESTLDVINLVLGIGLISAPWVFGFTGVEMANRNAWIAGWFFRTCPLRSSVV